MAIENSVYTLYFFIHQSMQQYKHFWHTFIRYNCITVCVQITCASILLSSKILKLVPHYQSIEKMVQSTHATSLCLLQITFIKISLPPGHGHYILASRAELLHPNATKRLDLGRPLIVTEASTKAPLRQTRVGGTL